VCRKSWKRIGRTLGPGQSLAPWTEQRRAAANGRNLQDRVRANDAHPVLAGWATLAPGKLELLHHVPEEGELCHRNAGEEIGAEEVHEEVRQQDEVLGEGSADVHPGNPERPAELGASHRVSGRRQGPELLRLPIEGAESKRSEHGWLHRPDLVGRALPGESAQPVLHCLRRRRPATQSKQLANRQVPTDPQLRQELSVLRFEPALPSSVRRWLGRSVSRPSCSVSCPRSGRSVLLTRSFDHLSCSASSPSDACQAGFHRHHLVQVVVDPKFPDPAPSSSLWERGRETQGRPWRDVQDGGGGGERCEVVANHGANPGRWGFSCGPEPGPTEEP
jgi:hypothetical protein